MKGWGDDRDWAHVCPSQAGQGRLFAPVLGRHGARFFAESSKSCSMPMTIFGTALLL
ncbi:MAG: hypothetical protein AAF411_23670 [Myxococcota bacterium]